MKIPFIDLKQEYLTIKNEVNRKILKVLAKAEYCYGEETKRFEASFARLAGCKYCLGVGSGTEALMLALKALGVGWGDEVITTSFTFIATVEAIVNLGARPVFVDIEKETMNINVDQVEAKISRRTKAIMPVHLYGVCVDMEPLLKIAKKHHLFVIEDAAHAEGSLYKGKPAGSLGDIGCFSLYPSKTLGAYGNAGAIVTNNQALFEKIKMFGNHGRGKNHDVHQVVGYTATIDNLQAAVLNVKLKYFGQWLNQKRKISQKYDKAFKNLDFVQSQKVPSFCQQSYYVYTIRTPKRTKLQRYLNKNNIQTKIYYPAPLHLQPSLKFLGYEKGDFPRSEEAVDSVLSLPLYPLMTDKEIDYVIEKLAKFSD